MDWNKAEEHLKECEACYSEIGRAGQFVIQNYLLPLRERFNKGERTQELYDAIFDIAL